MEQLDESDTSFREDIVHIFYSVIMLHDYYEIPWFDSVNITKDWSYGNTFIVN